MIAIGSSFMLERPRTRSLHGNQPIIPKAVEYDWEAVKLASGSSSC